ncbi:MAG: chitosanase [Pyrinomonadaceae bacterium]
MFNEIDKQKALAILRIFETGRAKARYDALAVLDDGAGTSYGFFQFTHRSGALNAVVKKYLAAGGRIGRDVLESRLRTLARTTKPAIERLSHDAEFRKALIAAAASSEMREAQRAVAEKRYIAPAERVCRMNEFETPLSLAVVLDGLVHGSFGRIARLVKGNAEQELITDYLRRRDAWLRSSVRLRKTVYRTEFFLGEAAKGNWQLRLPVTVNGRKLTAEDLDDDREAAGFPPKSLPETSKTEPQTPATEIPAAEPRPSILATAEAAFDQVDDVVTGIATRTERARSLWATVAGTLWQTLWAIVAFVAGIPREIWIITAVAAAILTAIYLYRQHSVSKIRASKEAK